MQKDKEVVPSTEVETKHVYMAYLYVVRVELRHPLQRGNWKTTQVSIVVGSPSWARFEGNLLSVDAVGGKIIKIVDPVMWEVGVAIPMPASDAISGWSMAITDEISISDANPVVAYWQDESHFIRANLTENGGFKTFEPLAE